MGNIRVFNGLAMATIILVYLVILAGGVVRASGSGMGCPDWPRCFGKWIPPTELAQLPAGYKDIYAEKRLQKNQRLAKVAGLLGFDDFAQQLVADKKMYIEADFNVLKTWIEYINRLLGVLVGGAILACAVVSVWHKKSRPKAFYYTVAALLLVIFQGFLGAFVVSTNLLGWLITVHLVLALGVLALLIMARQAARPPALFVPKRGLRQWYAALLAVVLAQIILGAQVRESVDGISQRIFDKWAWANALGANFIWHRSGAWVVLALVAGIGYHTWRGSKLPRTPFIALVLCVLAQVATGIGLVYFGFMPSAQALHILFSSLMFGICVGGILQRK